MPLTIENLQTGHQYRIVNYGEMIDFQVLDKIPGGDCKVKQLDTLEIFLLSDVTRFGRGNDYEICELRLR